MQQRIADRRHVDRARRAANQIGTLQCSSVDRKRTRRRQQRASGRIAPRADERRQARGRAHRIAAAVRALHAIVEANRRRLDRAVIVRKPQHLIGRDAAGLRSAFRRPFGGARRERVEPDGVTLDVISIDEIIRDQNMHDAVRERRVRSGQKRDVLMTLFRRRASIRIDGDDARAAPFRFLHARPQMQIRRDRIAAPDHDQPAVLELLEVHPDRCADDRYPSRFACSRANRAVEERCAQPMEKSAIHRLTLNETHRPAIAVRHDRLRAVRRFDDGSEALCDFVQRFIPRNAREASFAFAADTAHRVQNAIGRVRAIEVTRDFRAELSIRRRMRRIAANFDRLAVLDGDEHCARVRAIVRARRVDCAAFGMDRYGVERHAQIVLGR